MLCSWAVVLIYMRIVNSINYTMIVTYGQPVSAWDPITISADSWDSCVQLCYRDVFCVMAHGTVNFCHHYRIGKVQTAEQLPGADEEEDKIAVKATSNTCPSLLANSSTQTVTLSDPTQPGLKMSYTLTLSSATWTFQYSVTGICDSASGWQVFFRPTVQYCIKVVVQATAFLDQRAATAKCAAYNATLTGLESNEERLWVTNQATAMNLKTKGYNTTAVWVNGERSPDCSSLDDADKTQCQGITAFNFTDDYLVNKSGYQWATGQPDSYTGGRMQDCIQLWIIMNTTDAKHGMVDDNMCNYTTGYWFGLRGYACGKLPG